MSLNEVRVFLWETLAPLTTAPFNALVNFILPNRGVILSFTEYAFLLIRFLPWDLREKSL